MAFPVGAYAKYKQATSFFLDWLLLARGGGRRVAGAKLALDAFQAVVDQVVAQPLRVLTPRLLAQLPKALDACRAAITLRERVAAYFAATPGTAEMRRHEHFLSLLQTWHAQLAAVASSSESSSSTSSAASKTPRSSDRFANYYAVLELDDGYFDASVNADGELPAGGLQQPSAAQRTAERAALFDEAFSQDLLFEVVSYLLELEDLAEAVHSAYAQVKTHEKTLVEATAVVKVATECAASLTEKLQQRYPAIRLAADVLTILADKMPKGFNLKVATTAVAFWERVQATGYQFVPGVFFAEFNWVASALVSFTSVVQDYKHTLILRDGFFGETYSEERTPYYVLPDPSKASTLLLQQLPLLYNLVVYSKAAGAKFHEDTSLTGEFLAMMDTYFSTKQVTLPLVFTVVCWVKAVGCLQGEGGLGRTISLSIKHSWELLDRLERVLATRAVRSADREIHEMLKSLRDEVEQSKKNWLTIRANPLMAGFMLLDSHFKYLHLANETLLVTSRFRAFGHLYSALLDRRLLANIPFFDRVLELYEPTIFTPSRAAATYGSFTRTYFISSHMTEAAVDAMLRNEPPPRNVIQERNCLRTRDLSSVFRLLVDKDTSVLGHEIKGASPKALLAEVSRICSKELFDTRVLSRDMLRVNDDLADVFSELCDKLGRRESHDAYLARGDPSVTRQYRVNRALEDAVMTPLMPFLDCYERDGAVNASGLPMFGWIPSQLIDTSKLASLCQTAASVISQRFSLPPRTLHERYFIFPAQPDFARQEFGTAKFTGITQNDDRDQVFSDLMYVMEESDGPLSASEMLALKTEIKKDPEVLMMLSVVAVSSTSSSFRGADVVKSELCSLLHHAAAGATHDIRLVEWMIQMGALYNQPTAHCRQEPDPRARILPKARLPNQMAIHSAAVVGHTDIVRLMLEADNFRDLNTRTYHTQETLAHLAVRFGHRELFFVLVVLGADLRIKDRRGRSVSDMTDDPSWKQAIVRKTEELERSQRVADSAKNREVMLQHQDDVRAERLRRAINQQRDRERGRASARGGATASRSSAPTSRPNATRMVAPFGAPLLGVSKPLPQAALIAGGTAGSTSTTKKKRKGKKGKKKKGNKTVAQGAASAPAAPDSAGVVDLSSGSDSAGEDEVKAAGHILKDLLLSDGDAKRLETQSSGFEAELEQVSAIAQLPQTFGRLIGTSLPTAEVAAEVAGVSAAVQTLMGLVELLAMKDRINTTQRSVRVETVNQAVRTVHLLQRFHRFDHPPRLASALAPLHEQSGTNPKFGTFVIETSRLLCSLQRVAQAQELLDLLEKRLVGLKVRPQWFRELVQRYSAARVEAGLGKSSTAESLRKLEWYCSNFVENYVLQLKLDSICGHAMYSAMKVVDGARQLARAIAREPELEPCVCYKDWVLFWNDDEDDHLRVMEKLIDVTKAENAHFFIDSSKLHMKELRIDRFVFSESGVLRDA